MDFAFLLLMLAFVALSWGFVRACDRLAPQEEGKK